MPFAKITFPSGVVVTVEHGLVEGPPGRELYLVESVLWRLRSEELYRPDVDRDVAEEVKAIMPSVTIKVQKDIAGPEGRVY